MVETEELFKLSNDMADYVKQSPEGLRGFLEVAASTSGFTSHNQLLIQAYFPYINLYDNKVHLLKDFDEWAEQGISVNPSALPIYVMQKDNGDKTTYSPREVFDVSQTNANYNYNYKYDEATVTEALLLSSPVKIEYHDMLKVRGTKAIYRPDNNTIQVTKGFSSFSEIVASISMEQSHAFFYTQEKEKGNEGVYPRATYNPLARASAYMVLSRYGLVTSKYDMSELEQRMSGLKTGEVKAMLSIISRGGRNIIDRLDNKYNQIISLQSQQYQGKENV